MRGRFLNNKFSRNDEVEADEKGDRVHIGQYLGVGGGPSRNAGRLPALLITPLRALGRSKNPETRATHFAKDNRIYESVSLLRRSG